MPKYPYKPDDQKRNKYIQIKLTPEEQQRIRAAARRLGVKHSALVRDVFFRCLDGMEDIERLTEEFQHVEASGTSSPS